MTEYRVLNKQYVEALTGAMNSLAADGWVLIPETYRVTVIHAHDTSFSCIMEFHLKGVPEK